jgi:esterase/lipase
MKTGALVVMSAFLMSAAGQVFAWTNQDQLACELAQVNCPVETKSLVKRTTEIKNEIKKSANGPPEEIKKLEKMLQDAMDQLKKIADN